jgi:hypothetical protein
MSAAIKANGGAGGGAPAVEAAVWGAAEDYGRWRLAVLALSAVAKAVGGRQGAACGGKPAGTGPRPNLQLLMGVQARA